MSWLPPKHLPPIVCPTKTNVKNIYEPYIVPVIHPSHTKYQYHKIYEYQHHFPHSVSQSTDVTSHNVNCGNRRPFW